MKTMPAIWSGVMATVLTGLTACALDSGISPALQSVKASQAPVEEPLDEVLVGEFLFKDPRLSASGQMACVTCHAEEFGHADIPGTFLPVGGAALNQMGKRSSPTVRYLNTNPPFRLDTQGNAWGGFTWDGRADSRHDQAKDPFFEHAEMALEGSPEKPQALLKLVRSADYYPKIKAWYSADDLNKDGVLFQRVLQALAVYQRDDDDYNLFDSRFDQALTGVVSLTPLEKRGLAIFNNPDQGNCMACHTSQSAEHKPAFTDFGFRALGVPMNAMASNVLSDVTDHDLGLCRSGRKLPSGTAADRYCGQFKTPTLRNVERSAPYFHNGALVTLEEAVWFHFTRDTDPARWYGAGSPRYNDLPAKFHANVVQGKPFDGSWQPTGEDMGAMLAFLKTLNDADQKQPLHTAVR
ncbi:hypothetical protein LPB72_21990 [Hydrogenophaga crassostreae]|uniref:Cytochrome c domain-containing protein n=1 Tax=Hydrogenophaga crassostreae TaxID=1763535 RepID=A0A167GCP2_9BURK|nr:cytochrome c peroxidase [Hydrogenophaga crassostreae]AOW15181.1 hypothetical protein LPB072_22605 [Hydrogenophaga crassostreae]OAD39270.1 hypothetical protein LPB72_21990 [Hydrogenophaga crassostreae]